MKVDNELVKDWKESLNSLLLFAAIFAAVLTAFIIESKKLLEPDQTKLLVEAATLYFNNVGNLSNITFNQSDFVPEDGAIPINCLLFTALGTSLCAALISVMALQWVMDYDAAITRGGSSPEDRAKRRQFRYAGVLRWKMGEIIAALPLLLYSSVALFWAGVIRWMWFLNPIVGYVVTGGAMMAALIYATTTTLAVIFVSAPFRTPLSRGIFWVFHPTSSWLRHLLNKGRPGRILNWLKRPILKFTPLLKSLYRGTVKSKTATWLSENIIPHYKATLREERAADRNQHLGENALCWLAEQLPVSVDSHRRLLSLIGGILDHPHRESLLPRFLKAQGWYILDFVAWHYLGKALDGQSIEGDKGLELLLKCGHDSQVADQIKAVRIYKPGPSSVYWKQYNIDRMQGK